MRLGASTLVSTSDMPLVKRFRRALVVAILALTALPAPAGEALTFADDLAATAVEAAKRQIPVMIVFTEASCPYCTRAKRDYLVPMQLQGPFADKMIVREVDVASERRLRDFAGRLTTHGEYAQSMKVRLVPTVLVLDTRGEPVADPIVGLLAPDFYQLYLDQAVEAGLLKLRAPANERR